MHLLALPKIVLPDVAGRGEFACDNKGHYIIDTVYGIRVKKDSAFSLTVNKYQKIALLVGAIILILVFGKTITKVGFTAIASLGGLLWKFVLIIIATLVVISFFKKTIKKK